MSFNKVILIGNLTAGPELKKTANGVPVTSFRIAVGRRHIKQGEQPQADFIEIVAWRQQAEFVTQYFNKGKPILVCGQLQTRTWSDQNGQKHDATEVIADEIAFVGTKATGKKAAADQPTEQNVPFDAPSGIPSDDEQCQEKEPRKTKKKGENPDEGFNGRTRQSTVCNRNQG